MLKRGKDSNFCDDSDDDSHSDDDSDGSRNDDSDSSNHSKDSLRDAVECIDITSVDDEIGALNGELKRVNKKLTEYEEKIAETRSPYSSYQRENRRKRGDKFDRRLKR